MIDSFQSNPDELLQSVTREESQRFKGKLKIFLGMAAGVGKTYAMLEAARKLKADGVDVVAGVIATHGRQETANLLEGLELFPEQSLTYKDIVFHEFDIGGIIARKPKVVLIDELAHSNVPGSRHPKRWQDVIEILDQGIDVYTTLNVQHIESLKDVIEKIAGITIRETVPDLVIEQATSIEFIDLTPEELLQRLKEGRVYVGDQSIIAANNFFQEDRLTALREIVLRYAANKVDHDLKGMVSTALHTDSWKPRERFLVAISHSPHSQKLIRITKGQAFNFDAPWVAVHVDNQEVLEEEDQKVLESNLALARDLGAEVITTTDTDLARGIERIARQKNITQIIIGRPPRRWLIDAFQKNTLMDRLARECSDIDLHVIRQPTLLKAHRRKWQWPRLPSNLMPYLLVLSFVLALTFVNWTFLNVIGYKLSGFIFLLGILFMSLFFNRGPIFLGSVLYAVLWIVVFMPSKEVISPFNENIQLLGLYVFTAICTGILTDRARKNKEIALKREKTIEDLYTIVQDIANASCFEQVIISVKRHLDSIFKGKIEIVIKNINDKLIFENTSLSNNSKEQAAASWVFLNNKEAGWSTVTLPMTEKLYLPLVGGREIVGVLAYQPNADKHLTHEEKNFLYTVCHQLSNYLEHSYADQRAKKLENKQEIESVYRSILNLIQDLFEAPLIMIQESIKVLKKNAPPTIPSHIHSPIEQIDNAVESLSRILENISAMIQLNDGATPINRYKQSIEKLIKSCYERFEKSESCYKWNLKIDEPLPEISIDSRLIELLLINLIFHVMEYSLHDSTIQIAVSINGDYLMISISGEGQEISPELIDVSFESFYRLPPHGSSQLGIGLAIAKVIVQLHEGQFKVQSIQDKEMSFICYLPLS